RLLTLTYWLPEVLLQTQYINGKVTQTPDALEATAPAAKDEGPGEDEEKYEPRTERLGRERPKSFKPLSAKIGFCIPTMGC
ncbi:MAG: hypothetical protein M1830_009152, partial [Pleopsidium flavum]